MRKTLFIVIGLLSWTVCKGQNQTDIQNSEEMLIGQSVPKGFDCFNSKRVFIQYKQPVNGYTVKVMWLPYLNSKDNTTVETGVTTSLFFDSADNQFYINLEAKHIIDTLCYHYPHLKDGDVLYWDYVPKDSNEVLPHYSPFCFSDVDFDGKEELVITHQLGGSRSNNTYKIYKIHGYDNVELMTDEPFNDLENTTKFDSINKTITTCGSSGAYNYVIYTYKQKEYNTMDWNKPITIPKFDMIKAEVIDGEEYRIYEKKRGKLELVKQTKIH
ncbi:hypothetical protein KQP54_08870 [Bacteroides uniformis]|uniref:hypothetical protein n=1 Tax=Bacteroides uniformis TaxID=820 RepID=UPI00221F22D8|nr:hypothetical protein [Bacteroides uniformis]UYU54595.1 hypothetical protein KQP54_08870 [Bacteroides uniformis]